GLLEPLQDQPTPSKEVFDYPAWVVLIPLPLVSPCPKINPSVVIFVSTPTSHSSRAASIRRPASAPSAQPEPSPRSAPNQSPSQPRPRSAPRRKRSWHQSPL